MWVQRMMTAGEMIKTLEEFIGKLSLLCEDEIVSCDIEISTTDNCISDILYDRGLCDEECSELEDGLKTIPPHILHNYLPYGRDYAESDGYWDDFQEGKRSYFLDEIKPRLSEAKEDPEVEEKNSDDIDSILTDN